MVIALNRSITNLPLARALPYEDWNWTIAGSDDKQVTFFDYSYPINPSGLRRVIDMVYFDATRRLAREVMQLRPYRWSENWSGNNTTITFYPNLLSTWGYLADTIVALEEFMLRWDNVALCFSLNTIGSFGPTLGSGALDASMVS